MRREAARPGGLAIRNEREKEKEQRERENEWWGRGGKGVATLYPPCPRCLYFYCGECSVASSVVFRNYDTIPLHPLERCTAARQSLYILRYNRSTSLPVKCITRLDETREATAVNPLRFFAAVAYVRILCSRFLSPRSPVYLEFSWFFFLKRMNFFNALKFARFSSLAHLSVNIKFLDIFN